MKNSKEHGTFKIYYENGQLKEESNWINGELNGSSRSYFEDGSLEEEGNYINDKKEGEWREEFSSNTEKRLTKVVNYVNDKIEGLKFIDEHGIEITPNE